MFSCSARLGQSIHFDGAALCARNTENKSLTFCQKTRHIKLHDAVAPYSLDLAKKLTFADPWGGVALTNDTVVHLLRGNAFLCWWGKCVILQPLLTLQGVNLALAIL